jgi:hypothetical protein
MNINANLTNLIQSKKSVVLTRQSESNKIFKYIGGDSVIYKDLYVQSGNTNYAGHIYETGDTLSLNSESIQLNAASGVTVNGALELNNNKIIMNPIAIGVDCGVSGQSVSAIAIGFDAGRNNQGTSAVAIGNGAGYSNQKSHTIAIGTDSGGIQDFYSIGIGYQAGKFTQQQGAIAIGNNAGTNLQKASSIAIGDNCAGVQDTGAIAMGYQTSNNNTQGSYAIAIGYTAAQPGQGSEAIAIGFQSGTTTDQQGAGSICIGSKAKSTQAKSIVINASLADLNASTQQGFFVNPIRGAAASTLLYYNTGTSEITYLSSSRETKDNINNLNTDTSVVLNLQPKTFTYKSDPQSGTQVGYIAEEVAEINPHFAGYNSAGGNPVSINYNNIVVFLLEEVKRLNNKVNSLETIIQNLNSN